MTAATTNGAPLLAMRGVSKRFGAVQALAGVDLDIHAGEVVALVGDNGAGKSTLVKTISGVGPMDDGSMTFDGDTVTVREPSDSDHLGIAVIYQDLALCDNLDVVANIFLGHETRRAEVPLGPMDDVAMEKEARSLLDSLAVRTLRSVKSEVGSLSGGQRQTVAIARALLGEPKLVLLDEPTAALGVAQTAQVLALVRRLADRGLGVVIISHNLGDVFQVADRIVVLRLGRNAGDFPATPDKRDVVVSASTGARGGDLSPDAEPITEEQQA
jgi:D-xylose transport system ATP-binding protein